MVIGKTGCHHLVHDGALSVLEGSAETFDELSGGGVCDGVEKLGLVFKVAVRGGGGDAHGAGGRANCYGLGASFAAKGDGLVEDRLMQISVVVRLRSVHDRTMLLGVYTFALVFGVNIVSSMIAGSS